MNLDQGWPKFAFDFQVIVLQTYWRRWLAKNYVQRLREDRLRRMEWERQEELRKQKERAKRIKREWERRMNPKTKEDFDLLYAHLESEYIFTRNWDKLGHGSFLRTSQFKILKVNK